MINDKFLGLYLKTLHDKIASLKTDLAEANFSNLYEVGKLQGQIVGLEVAIVQLQAAYEELDQ